MTSSILPWGNLPAHCISSSFQDLKTPDHEDGCCRCVQHTGQWLHYKKKYEGCTSTVLTRRRMPVLYFQFLFFSFFFSFFQMCTTSKTVSSLCIFSPTLSTPRILIGGATRASALWLVVGLSHCIQMLPGLCQLAAVSGNQLCNEENQAGSHLFKNCCGDARQRCGRRVRHQRHRCTV